VIASGKAMRPLYRAGESEFPYAAYAAYAAIRKPAATGSESAT
jgi:hypothetical protein